jgi:hypothetical protein
VPPRKERCVLCNWVRSLMQTCTQKQGRGNRKIKNGKLQNELDEQFTGMLIDTPNP